MQVTREVGIKLAVDSTAVAVGTVAAARDFDRMGNSVQQAADKSARSLSSVSLELKSIVGGAAALTVVSSLVNTVAEALTSLPRDAFNYTKNIEASTVGMAGILGSMTAINGKQTEYNTALAISSQYIRKLNDDALRTAATSQELVATFQALLAPGLAAKMTLDEVRQLTVVGTNAVKSIGLQGNQVVQELRDLVAGGITAASSSLAGALGLKDEDIAKAKASSQGLFAFLMERMQGFKASSDAFGGTLQGRMDSLKEGAVRVVSDGLTPLTNALKTTLGEAAALFTVIDKSGDVQLNPALVESIAQYGDAAIKALAVTKDVISGLYEHREAVLVLWTAYKAYSLGQWTAEAVMAVKAKVELAAASRFAAAQAALEGTTNTAVVQTTREKVAAYLAELEAVRQVAQGRVADAAALVAETTAKTASLALSREAVVLSRAEATAKLAATQTTIAQAEAQLAAAQSAGALSFALAMAREATSTLSVAQARHAALLAELAVLGRQQAAVVTATTAATAAQTAATLAHAAAEAGATAATTRLATATASTTLASSAAAMASRSLGAVLGALGGTIGITVMAVAGLVMWFYKSRDAALQAEDAAFRFKRAKDALAEGKPVESRDIISITAQLDTAQKALDEIEKRQTTNTTAAGRKAAAMAQAQAEVNKFDNLLKQAQSGGAGRDGAENLTLSLAATQQAWEKTVAGAKTASAAQEEYQQKIDASRASFTAYQAMLEKTGASTEVIAKAQKRQADTETAFAVDRDRKLKEMNASAITATSHTIDAQVEQLKRKAQVEEVLDKRSTDLLQTRLQLGLVSERDYLEQIAAVELQGLAKTRAGVEQELGRVSKKKDSLKEQAALTGQLAVLDEKTTSRKIVLTNALLELDEKRRKEALALSSASVNTAQQELYALEDKNRATAMEIEAIGLNEQAMHRLTTARMDEIIARQAERIEVLKAFDLAGQSQDLIDIEIRKLEALKTARNLNGQRYGVEQIAKINEAWLTLKNDVYMGLTDSLYRAFEAGNGFFKTFWDGIKNTFKTTVLKLAVQGVVNGVTGALGLGTTSTAGGGGGSGGLINTASNAYSLYGAATGYSNTVATGAGLLGAGSTAGSSALALGYGNAVGAVGGDALGAMIAGNAGWGGVAVEGGAALGSGAAATGTAAAAEGGAAAAGTGVLASIPVWGWVALAVIALGAYFGGKGGGPKVGSSSGVGVDSLAANSTPDSAKSVTTSIEMGFKNTAAILGDTASTLQSGVAFAMDPQGTAQTQLQVVSTVNGQQVYNRGNRLGRIENVDRGDEALTKAIAEESIRAVYAGLQASNIAQQMKDYLAGVDIGSDTTLLTQRLNEVLQVKALATAYAGLNNNLSKVFDSSTSASQALLSVFGGLEAFNTKFGAYYSNFYSEQERNALTAKNLSASLATLGYILPTTRDGFRALVDAQDLSTDAGRKTYVALLGLSDAFASITDVAPTAAEALDKTTAALKAAAAARLDTASTNASGAYSALERAVAAQRSAAEMARDVANEQVTAIKSVFDTLKTNVQALYGSVAGTSAMQAAQGQAFIDQALATAKSTGYLPDNAALAEAIGAARSGVEGGVYGSQFESDYARLSLAATLSQLQEVSGTQLTNAELSLKAAQSQVDGLTSLLDNAKLQLDAANGIDNSVKSVAAAVGDLNVTIRALFEERTAQGLASTAGAGVSIPAFAAGGDHAGGVRLVGEFGPELELTGASRIYSASQTRDLLQGGQDGGNTDAMVTEVRALREENRAQALALVQMQARMAKVLDRWDGIGMPAVRDVA